MGAGLAFIASVIVFRRPTRLQGRRLLLAACILVFGFIGCIMIWSSNDVALDTVVNPNKNPAGTRAVLFDVTEGTVAVLVVFLVGISCEIVTLVYLAAFLSAFYNLSSMGTYLTIKVAPVGDLLREKELDTAGIVFCWLSAVFMTFFCAFEEHSEYDDIGSDSNA